MDFQEYSEKALATMSRDTGRQGAEAVLTNAAMGAAGEGGECVDLMKKVLFHGHPLDEVVIKKLLLEAGDVLWYVNALMAGIRLWAVDRGHTWFEVEGDMVDLYHLTLEDVAVTNIRKLANRYQSGQFTAAESRNRIEPLRD